MKTLTELREAKKRMSVMLTAKAEVLKLRNERGSCKKYLKGKTKLTNQYD